MMRSIASQKPISPFHLMAADEMERLLDEVLTLRKAIQEQAMRNIQRIGQELERQERGCTCLDVFKETK
jgi:hypothetical protein